MSTETHITGEMSYAEWVLGHDRMIGVIQRTIHERLGRWPVLQANGVRNHSFEKGQSDGGYSKQLLIPAKLKQRPLDAYHTEETLRCAKDHVYISCF